MNKAKNRQKLILFKVPDGSPGYMIDAKGKIVCSAKGYRVRE